MKKVLIIAYSFPPRPDVGSQRPYRLAKYFPDFGWEPIVLTAKLLGEPPEGIKIIETNYKDIDSAIKSRFGFNPEKGLHEQLGIRITKDFNYQTWKSKFIKLIKEIIYFPDAQRGWYKYALKSASECLEREEVDAIISTSSPVTAHLIARKLKRKYKILWIADLRDPWTQNPYVNKFGLIRYFERRLELKTLSNADALVTVTDPWLDLLGALHKNKEILCVTNGYDEDDFPDLTTKLTNKFVITYTGILYNGKRDPSLLFKVISQLIVENKINRDLIEIRFYGPKEDWLVEEIKKYKLEGIANVYGRIPREEVLKKQKESQLLLVLLWNNKNEEGFCPAKIYEYFGSRRPVLAIGGHGGVVKDLLAITDAGRFADNSDNLRDILLNYYQEFIQLGEVRYNGNANIENYSYKLIAKRYSEILNGLILK